MRKRPNTWINRYNQWVIAGKIAIQTKAINPYNNNGDICSAYRNNNGDLHYSVIGQVYLSSLQIDVAELS